MHNNVTICITGGIGSGKSVVSRLLRCNGLPVFDCDFEAKLLMTRNPEVKKALTNSLGRDIYFEDGSLDRKKLAGMLFSDPEVRKIVNEIVHTGVRKEISECRHRISGTFFIETAIPATGGIASHCDKIWLVEAPLEERLKRVAKRDGLSESEIKKRIEVQDKEFSSLDGAKTIILENSGNNPLLCEILGLIDKNIITQTYNILC